MRAGVSGIEESKVPKLEFMRDASCSDCHMYSTGPPQNITGHTFRPKMEACVSCHASDPRTFPITVDQASGAVDSWQSITIERLLSTESNLTLARNAIDNANQYHFSSQVLNDAQDLYDDANYSYSFVIADRSQGAHNLPYALALLDFANTSARDIIDMLTPGEVIGKVVDKDGNDVTGASIEFNNEQIAVTGSDGSFSVDIASGTYTFKITKGGSTLGSVENVQVFEDETTDLGTISTEPTQGGFDLVILAVVLTIIVVVVVVVYFVRFKPPKENEEPDEDL
jgi:hypothetical protein